MTKIFIAGTTAGQKPLVTDRGEFDSDSQSMSEIRLDQNIAARVNILESFYYVSEWQTRNIHRFKRFMLDSGAFTFVFGSKKHVNIEDYTERYIEYINENNVEYFFEMDIDAIVGYEKVKQIRKHIEEKTNRQVIPVFHYERGKNEWLRMCDEYDYVAIGGIAVAKGRRKIEPYIPWLTSQAHKRGTKVHGLGYTNLGNLSNTGFDSVDSSAWLYGNRGGFVYHWDGNKMQKINVPKGKKLDSRAAARHNFMEWVKMGESLER